MSTIIVSGLGIVTSLGANLEDSYNNIIKGNHGISNVDVWDVSEFISQLAGQIKFPLPLATSKVARNLDRGHKLLLCSVKQALQDANLLENTQGLKVGIIVGTSLAGMESMQRYDKELYLGKNKSISNLINQPLHVSADLVAKEFNLTGPRLVISTACTASTIAIGCAIAMLRCKKADVIIAAGCDQLSAISYTGFSSMKNMSAIPCSPFSEHVGLNLGEGSGAIILEREDFTTGRNIKPYLYARDYMFTADGYHPTSPDPKGRANECLLKTLMDKSQLHYSDIDYINMHGTGTAGNDITETEVVGRLFYKNGQKVPVSSIKGAIGHTLGAAGVVESVLTIKAMCENQLLPTVNFTKAREGCFLDYVPNRKRELTLCNSIVQNFAFGGNNAAILFSKDRLGSNKSSKRRVVVTGMSAITPLGHEFKTISNNIQQGHSAIQDVFSEEYNRFFKAAKLADFNPREFIKINTRRMDRLSQLIVAASYLALTDSGLNPKINQDTHIGFISGTMHGHADSNLKFHREILSKAPQTIDPFTFPNTVTNAGSGQASVINRLKGCNIALSAGQGSGLCAINLAYHLIQDGLHPVIIAGGADELTDYILYNYYRATLSRSHSKRPIQLLDKLFLNEGAAYFVLEEYEHAENRGAKIYAEIIDCDNTTVDINISTNSKSSAASATSSMEQLLNANEVVDKLDNVYSSSLNYRGFIDSEFTMMSRLLRKDFNRINLHPYLGISALTSAVSFGLACTDQGNYSLINAASIGGAFYSNLIKKWARS